MGLMNPAQVLSMLRVHKNLCIVEDMWWTKEDLHAYPYLQKDNKDQLGAILPYLRGHSVAVQAGAHCGYTIRQLEPHFARIYCFEPDPTMFLALGLNLPNPNIYKIQACLGHEHRLVGLKQNNQFRYSGANFVCGPGHIPMLTIDDLALDACDLIMLDIEGFEIAAIGGALQTIRKYHPLLCLEIAWGYRTLGVMPGQIEQILSVEGYKEIARAGESDRVYQFKGVNT